LPCARLGSGSACSRGNNCRDSGGRCNGGSALKRPSDSDLECPGERLVRRSIHIAGDTPATTMLALPVEAAVPAAKDKTHRRRHALPLQCAFFLVEAAVPAARGAFAGDMPATTAATLPYARSISTISP